MTDISLDESPGLVPTPAAPPVVASRSRLSALTVADGLMALIGALALWLRFGELTRLPLSAAEATAALANWQFWSASPLQMPVTSPAYFAFTHLTMSFGGSGDAAARLVPAVFGLLTVLLPWLWRRRVQPAMWLVAGLFLAVSPLLVAVSRTAGGDAIALFALLLLVVAASSNWPGTGERGERVDRRWAIAGGAALGLGLTSSPLFYSGLVGLLAAALAVRPMWNRASPAAQNVQPADAAGRNQDSRGRASLHLRPAAVAAAATFLLVATSVLLYPAGLGAALRLFPAWLAQFRLPPDSATALTPLLALARYEPAVVVLGLPALVWALLNGRRGGRFLAVWFGVSLLASLLQSSVMATITVALLPGYLLVGQLAAGLAAPADNYGVAGRRTAWYTAAALVGLGALMLAAAGRFARLNLLSGENATLITLAMLAFVLAGVAVVLAMAWESPAARRGAFAGVAALLIFWQWGAAWQLSRQGANDPRERWVVEGTDDDLPVMVDLLGDLSRQLTNSNRDLSLFSQVDSPVLRWYLRDLSGLQIGPALPVNAAVDAIITPAEIEPALPNDYFGADFGLVQHEVPNAGPVVVSDVLKWWLFRESTAALDTQRVVLWVRSDLAREE